jgi:hypothetical protein
MPSPFPADLTSPAAQAFPIIPDDDVDLALHARSIYVGGGGSLRVVPARGVDPVTFAGLAAGSILPVMVRRVLSTGTTASLLVGLR